jgi:flagellin
MSLIVNTNMSSLTAQRSIAGSDRALETAMERLSSGKRINSASDDAAGLAIVERMTSQIKGLNMAVKNANDGIAMTQSIEGALVEVTDMLQRIRELAVQSANDTNTGIDRGYLQEEIVLLQAELSRVASNTRYNGQLVLDGNYTSKKLHVGTEGGESISVSIDSVAANALGAYTKGTTAIAALTAASSVPANGITGGSITVMGGGAAESLTVAAASSAKAVAALINGKTGTTGVTANAKTYVQIAFAATGSYTFELNGSAVGTFSASTTSVSDAVAKINSISGTTGVTATANAAGNAVMLYDADGDDITLENTSTTSGNNITAVAYDHDGTTAVTGTQTLTDTGGTTEATRIIGNISLSSSSVFSVVDGTTAPKFFTTGAASLSSVSNVNIATQSGANSAIAVVDGAIEKVSSMRAKLGAIENRLEHTVSNLMNIAENTQDSRSRIQDADFSVESANLAKAQVLQQVGAAMLTQANARPQLVLQLLQ